MSKDNTIAWFEIYVSDMERAKKFYEAVFDVKLEKLINPIQSDLEMWMFPGNMEKYGAVGALVKMEGVEVGKNSTLVYFSCEDCAIEEKRAAGLGAKIHMSKTSIGESGFVTILNDTEGNIIGLHSSAESS